MLYYKIRTTFLVDPNIKHGRLSLYIDHTIVVHVNYNSSGIHTPRYNLHVVKLENTNKTNRKSNRRSVAGALTTPQLLIISSPALRIAIGLLSIFSFYLVSEAVCKTITNISIHGAVVVMIASQLDL
jgi:hypothetical protein